MNNYNEQKVKQILEIIEKDKKRAKAGGWENYFSKNYKDLYQYILESTSNYFSKYGFDFDLATRIKFLIEDRIEPIECEGCHKPILANNKISHKWQRYHNYDCRKLDKKSFSINKEKYKARTGYDHPMHNPMVRQKHEEHNLKVYHAKHFFGSEKGKDVLKESYNRNLGVDNPSYSPDVVKRISLSQRKTHYYEKLLKDQYVKPLFTFEKYSTINRAVDWLWWECQRCGRPFAALIAHGTKNAAKSYAICPYCFPKRKFNSTEEFLITDWLSSLTSCNVYHRQPINRNTINGELDIFIPDLNFAIEYNGIYWHSEKFRNESTTNHYSIFEKTKQCEEKGIILFHIYEDEWINLRTKHKIETIIKKILFHRNQLFEKILDRDIITLPRDKFPLILKPTGFSIESIKEPFLEKHGNYEILNAGTITYRKL